LHPFCYCSIIFAVQLTANFFTNATVQQLALSVRKTKCMKSSFFIGLLLLLATGCSKSPVENTEAIENTVVGQWTYTEYFYSTGAPGQWYPVTPANQIIEFKADGSFTGTASFLKDATHFVIVDSTTIKFLPSTKPAGYALMNYRVKTAERELILSPLDPICIEGCSDKFKR